MYDLHIHTKASDGILSATEVIDYAMHINLKGIAITDHDTVNSLEVATRYIQEFNIPLEFVPGIELNTDYNDAEVHILGYFIDFSYQPMLDRLVELRQSRHERAEKMIEKLHNMGLVINLDMVQRLAEGDLIGRPHIARALVEKGYVFSVKEAFDKYISKGRPAYVPRYKFLPAEAMDIIRNAGGISILAHPGLIKNNYIIHEIISLGVEGLEVYYPEHSQAQIDYYLKLCKEKGLLITGGSDFHGMGSTESRSRLGCAGIDAEHFTRLYNKHHKI